MPTSSGASVERSGLLLVVALAVASVVAWCAVAVGLADLSGATTTRVEAESLTATCWSNDGGLGFSGSSSKRCGSFGSPLSLSVTGATSVEVIGVRWSFSTQAGRWRIDSGSWTTFTVASGGGSDVYGVVIATVAVPTTGAHTLEVEYTGGTAGTLHVDAFDVVAASPETTTTSTTTTSTTTTTEASTTTTTTTVATTTEPAPTTTAPSEDACAWEDGGVSEATPVACPRTEDRASGILAGVAAVLCCSLAGLVVRLVR